MRSWLKVLLALALVLPLGAFVAGSLVASAADEPAPRDTIIIDDSGSTPSSKPSGNPSPSRSPSPSASSDPSDNSGPGDDDDDDVEGVNPTYGEVDDDDHSGPGGGGDDDDHGDDGGGDDDDDGRGGGDD